MWKVSKDKEKKNKYEWKQKIESKWNEKAENTIQMTT